jgi:hypothetical protein
MRRRVLVLGLLLFAAGALATVTLVHRDTNEPKPSDVPLVYTVVGTTYCIEGSDGSSSYVVSPSKQMRILGNCP